MSSYSVQIGTIYTQIITKPAYNPFNILHNLNDYSHSFKIPLPVHFGWRSDTIRCPPLFFLHFCCFQQRWMQLHLIWKISSRIRPVNVADIWPGEIDQLLLKQILFKHPIILIRFSSGSTSYSAMSFREYILKLLNMYFQPTVAINFTWTVAQHHPVTIPSLSLHLFYTAPSRLP